MVLYRYEAIWVKSFVIDLQQDFISHTNNVLNQLREITNAFCDFLQASHMDCYRSTFSYNI